MAHLTSITLSEEAHLMLEKLKNRNDKFKFSHWVSNKLMEESHKDANVNMLEKENELLMEKISRVEQQIMAFKLNVEANNSKIDELVSQEKKKKAEEKEKEKEKEQNKRQLIDTMIDNFETFFEEDSEKNLYNLAAEYVNNHSKFGNGDMSMWDFAKQKGFKVKPQYNKQNKSI